MTVEISEAVERSGFKKSQSRMSADEEAQVYKVQTSDGKIFELLKFELGRCLLLQNAFLDLGADVIVPTPSVDSQTFQAILDFLKNSYGNENYIHTFVETYDFSIRAILLAAQYLEVSELTDALALYISKQIEAAGKAQAMKEQFGLRGDLSPAQQENVQRRLNWAKV
jgi:hypothetical protein